MEMSITEQNFCFTNSGHSENQTALGLYEMTLKYEPQEELKAVRYVPFALFIPTQYISDFAAFWDNCAGSLLLPLTNESVFADVEYYSEAIDEKAIMSSIRDTVIILGNYDEPYNTELREVRDQIIGFGYDSFLIEELPSPPEMSLEETVRLWTTASRFCVMIDREASGHIKEYEMVKEERKPLVFLQPENSGSTWMIGDDDIVDLNYIGRFEFTDSPLSEIKDGVQWAEEILQKRGNSYPKFYPWIDEKS